MKFSPYATEMKPDAPFKDQLFLTHPYEMQMHTS